MNEITICSGTCLKLYLTDFSTSSEISSNCFELGMLGKVTLTVVRVPLCQLNPTKGLIPMFFSRSFADNSEYLRPSFMLLAMSQPASNMTKRTMNILRIQ